MLKSLNGNAIALALCTTAFGCGSQSYDVKSLSARSASSSTPIALVDGLVETCTKMSITAPPPVMFKCDLISSMASGSKRRMDAASLAYSSSDGAPVSAVITLDGSSVSAVYKSSGGTDGTSSANLPESVTFGTSADSPVAILTSGTSGSITASMNCCSSGLPGAAYTNAVSTAGQDQDQLTCASGETETYSSSYYMDYVNFKPPYTSRALVGTKIDAQGVTIGKLAKSPNISSVLNYIECSGVAKSH